MNKFTVFVFFFIIIINSICKGQIVNSSFEQWSYDSLGQFSPDNWSTTHSQFGTTIYQTSGIDGLYAVRLAFVYNFNVGYHTGGGITQLNIPLLNKPDSIVGWFRMNDGDARLNLYLSVEDSSAYQVGSAAATLLQTTLSWTRFSIPVLYGSSGNSSTAVLLYSAGGAHSDTSYVEVDNVALINNLANNNEMEFAIKTPILTLSVIDGTIYLKNISKLSLQNLDIELFNIDGRLIKTLYFTEIIPASTILVTNTSSFPIGCYFIAVKSKSTSGIFKLFIFN